jgi:uncharacterized protein (UPF0332 family)
MKQPNIPDIGTNEDVAKHRLHMANEDLESAIATFDLGQYRTANNRAYYSIFHAISAVLAKEGVAFKHHKEMLGYFNKNYINKGIFPRELGRKILKAEEIRHSSDYDTFYIASKEVTYQQIETAKTVINLVEKYLDLCETNKEKL